jgi:hypothetical protein
MLSMHPGIRALLQIGASAAHDGKSFDTMSFHHLDDRFQRIVLGNGEGIGRHDLIDLLHVVGRTNLREQRSQGGMTRD